MPSSAVRTFSDADEYAAAIRQGTVELTIIERGHFNAKITRIDLHRLWLQRFSENLSRVAHVAGWGGRVVIAFRTQPGPSQVRSGFEMQPTDIVRHGEGQAYFHRSSGPAHYGAMSLPLEDMASVGAAIAGCDLSPPRDPLLITPSLRAMARLQRLHAAAGELAETAPEIIANPDAAHGLERALVEAMIGCLGAGEVRCDSVAQRRHEPVMRRFRTVLEEHPDRALYLSEICAAIKVSDRTLRACCQEGLGMGPQRFLLLRRLHLARRALREAVRSTATVTEIATQFGFWELGRFAVRYGSLFGESPSATLSGRSDRHRQTAIDHLPERFAGRFAETA